MRTMSLDEVTLPPWPAVVAAWLWMLGATLLATFVGGVLEGLRPGRVGDPAPVLLVVAVLAVVTAASRVWTRRVLPRAAGEVRPDRRTRTGLAVVAATLTAPLVALLSASGWLGWLGWTVLLAAPAAAGAALDPARPLRSRWSDRGGEEGGTTAEQVAVVAIVAAVVAALFLMPLAPTVGAWGRYAVCILFGGSDCVHPDEAVAAAGEDQDWEPDQCVVSSRDRFVDANLGVTWLDLGTRQGYTTLQMDDGTYRVIYTGENTVGASKSGGVYLELNLGEEDWTSGAYASASAALQFTNGVAWDFDSAEEADAWVSWHLRDGLAAEMMDNLATRSTPVGNLIFGGGRDSLYGQVNSAGNRFGNWLLNQVGLGTDVPPTPEDAEVFTAGGYELDAAAELGYVFVGEAGGSVGNATQLGTSERADGTRTIYLEVDSHLLVDAEINMGPEAAAGWNDRSQVAVTLDEQGRPTQVDLQLHRIGSPGRDFDDVDGPRDAIGTGWHADAQGEQLSPSLYQFDLTLDLDPSEHDGLGDLLATLGSASGAVVPGRPGSIADRLFDEGRMSVVEYNDRERLYGGSLAAGASAELGGGIVYGDRELDAINASYYDRSSGGFLPLVRCLG